MFPDAASNQLVRFIVKVTPDKGVMIEKVIELKLKVGSNFAHLIDSKSLWIDEIKDAIAVKEGINHQCQYLFSLSLKCGVNESKMSIDGWRSTLKEFRRLFETFDVSFLATLFNIIELLDTCNRSCEIRCIVLVSHKLVPIQLIPAQKSGPEMEQERDLKFVVGDSIDLLTLSKISRKSHTLFHLKQVVFWS